MSHMVAVMRDGSSRLIQADVLRRDGEFLDFSQDDGMQVATYRVADVACVYLDAAEANAHLTVVGGES